MPKDYTGKVRPEQNQPAFDIANPTKVVKPNDKQQQNFADNATTEYSIKAEARFAAIEALAKDTSNVAQTMQKLVNLINVANGQLLGNIADNPAIKALLNSIMLSPEQLMGSMVAQQSSATAFTGKIFDLLRNILVQNPDNPSIKNDVLNLLKFFDGYISAESTTNSITSTIDTLIPKLPNHFAEALETEQQKMSTSSDQQAIKKNLNLLKNEIIPLLGKIVSSKKPINEEIRSFVMLVVHNTVRLERADITHLMDAAESLLANFEDKDGSLKEFAMSALVEAIKEAPNKKTDVIDKIVELLEKTLESEETTSYAKTVANNTLIGILSNNSTDIPIMHILLPMNFFDLNSIAEIWVDPNSNSNEQTGSSSGGGTEGTRMFFTADVENVGIFEVDLFFTKEKMTISMLCPSTVMSSFENFGDVVAQIAARNGYSIDKFFIGKFEKPKKIADVFSKLKHRRVGIDVKV